jgi:hypothetical protein
MKKTLKTAGALGLAAATILTGLSFGPAAASAGTTDQADTNAADRLVGSLVLHRDDVHERNYASVGWPDGSTNFPVNVGLDADAVAAMGDEYEVPDFEAVGLVRGTSGAGADMCLALGAANYFIGVRTCSSSDPQQQFHWVDTAKGKALRTDGAPGVYLTHHLNKLYATGDTNVEATIETGYLHAKFSGNVASVDIAGRSAEIAGYAASASTVIINGTQQVEASDQGEWSATVTGLALGVNTVTLEQFENGIVTNTATIDIDLAVEPVTATASFPEDPTQDAVLSGTAHPGATVVVQDAAGVEIDRTPVSPVDGTWRLDLAAPNVGGDYTVSVRQEINDEVAGTVDVTVPYGDAVTIIRPVPDAVHAGGPLTMRGTGEAGARIEVTEQGDSTVIGDEKVLVNRLWNLTTTDLDAGKHVLEVTQAGKGGNVTTSTLTLNPDASAVDAPTVESPAAGSTVTTSRPTFTGHGQDGATITIGYGPNSIIGTAVVKDGEWTIAPTRGLGMGVSNLVVTQTAGTDVQTLTHTLTRVAVEQPLAVTSHVDGQTYAEGITTFRGTAPVGSVVRATNQWGTVMGTATATDGNWSFNRNLGPTTAGYELTLVATPPVGAPQTVSLKLVYAGTVAFQVTSPVNDSTYTVGTATFTGTAAPGTAVRATNQWGTLMGTANTALGTTWAFDRYLGPTSAGYDITFVATKGTDVQRSTLHLKTAVVNAPVVVTSHADGATYRPGMNVLAGTGTPGATVEAVNATNGWNVPMGRATVSSTGNWALPERNWGPSNDYAVQVTQTNPDKTTSTTTVNVKAPVFSPLTLTSPAVGDTYDTGVAARFEGTATPFATVTVRSAKSSTVYRTVEADVDGNWSFTRVWGPTHDYVLNIDQTARNGQSDSITGFAWNHSGN